MSPTLSAGAMVKVTSREVRVPNGRLKVTNIAMENAAHVGSFEMLQLLLVLLESTVGVEDFNTSVAVVGRSPLVQLTCGGISCVVLRLGTCD